MKKRLLSVLLAFSVVFSCLSTGIVSASSQKSYDYQIIQNFDNQNSYTRNSMWSRGMLTNSTNPKTNNDGATDIYQFDAKDVSAGNDRLNGTPALAVRMISDGRGWGSTHLVNDTLPAVKIQNMSGIFFRFKTDTTTSTVLSITTVGKSTTATGTLNTATNPNGTLLTDNDKNDNNNCGNAGALLDEYSITKNSTNIRYYSTSGELIATGREVPAGFDGYVFIEVKNFDSYTKDGLTINWIDSDYKYAKEYTSIGDTNHKWCLNGNFTKAIIDNLGYYSVSDEQTDYRSIILDFDLPHYDYEIIQDFSDGSTYTRNSMWSRGLLSTTVNADTDGAASIYQFDIADINAGKDRLNGTPALALRMTSAGKGWGSTHLMNGSLPDSSISNISGVFFRFKTNTTVPTVLSVTTVGKSTAAVGNKNTAVDPQGTLLTNDDKNTNNNCGNGGALLDAYSLTKNSTNIRYYSVSGDLISTGRAVPAGFDGYIFIEVKNFDSYSKDGLTINWTDSDYKYATDFTNIGGSNNKWCINGLWTTAIIDNLGYYSVSESDDGLGYGYIISDMENIKYDYEIIQTFSDSSTYTRNSMWSRGMLASAKNTDTGATDGATNIYQFDAADQDAGKDKLNGTSALALRMTSAGKGWGSSHLINGRLPETKMNDISGLFFRFKTDTKTATVLSLTTVGKSTAASGTFNASTSPQGALLSDKDKNDNNNCGNGGALLDEYSLTKNSDNIRYLNTNGVLVGSGKNVPAGFDGYVFVEVKDFDSFVKDGLTINWIDSDYKYAKEYTSIGDTDHKWCLNGSFTSAVIDDVGYYYIARTNDSSKYYSSIVSERESLYKGDVNFDNAFNVYDLVDLIKLLLSSESLKKQDFNGDGSVNILDLVALKKHIVKEAGASKNILDSLPEPKKSNTDWFKDSKYGIMVHCTEHTHNNGVAGDFFSDGKKTSWDECVNDVDAEKFAAQVSQTGAGYVILCIQQQYGYFAAPISEYENKVGYKPGEACSTRDLPLDIMNALAEYDIPFMLYFTGDGCWRDVKAFSALSGKEFKGEVCTEEWNDEYVRNWSKMMLELSMRYGKKLAGWYFDGMDATKFNEDDLYFFAKAAKAGNPDSILSFNGAQWTTATATSRYEDFTFGEQFGYTYYPSARFVKGKDGLTNVQWHMMAYLDGDNTGIMHTAEETINYINAVNDKEGVITFDIDMNRYGEIRAEQLEVMRQVKAAIRK